MKHFETSNILLLPYNLLQQMPNFLPMTVVNHHALERFNQLSKVLLMHV